MPAITYSPTFTASTVIPRSAATVFTAPSINFSAMSGGLAARPMMTGGFVMHAAPSPAVMGFIDPVSSAFHPAPAAVHSSIDTFEINVPVELPHSAGDESLAPRLFSDPGGVLYEKSYAPSGLVVRPVDGAGLETCARHAVSHEESIPNNRIVLDLRGARSVPQISPSIRVSLQQIADESGVTIAVRTMGAPYMEEIEPAVVRVEQESRPPMFAMGARASEKLDPRWRTIYDRIMKVAWRTDRPYEKQVECIRGCVDSGGWAAQSMEEFMLTDLVDLIWKIGMNEFSNMLTPDERAFLLEAARRNVRMDDPYVLYSLFRTLHDFEGLRLLLRQIGISGERETYLKIVLALEDFDKLLSLGYRGSSADKLEQLREKQYDKLHEYVARYGFDEAPPFDLFQTAPNLTALSRVYDVFIAVARGGLYSGSVADFLGLPNLVVDVHAHERRHPETRWVSEVRPQDIAGKRVLLLDKDAVTGASIEWALKLVLPYGPREVAVYFNHNAEDSKSGGYTSSKAIGNINGLGVRVYYPANLPEPQLGRTFYELNERLGTPLGRLRVVSRAFNDGILPRLQRMSRRAADAVQRYVEERVGFYFSLNQYLPGMEDVRSHIVSGLEGNLKLFDEILSYAYDKSIITAQTAAQQIIAIVNSQAGPPSDFAESLAKGRYFEEGRRLAALRRVENAHVPQSFTMAFRTAKEAVESGNYDVALIVGPEGFAYEPIFRDLGMPTVAVNIPESNFGGRRTMKKFDDLSGLRGRRVLVVEDDVQSGATLRKLLETLDQLGVEQLGLFLGLPGSRQIMENIPMRFRRVYVSDHSREQESGEIFLGHLRQREVIYKDSRQE